MEYKKLKSLLLIIFIIILFCAILVLLKVLFSGAKGFEWGSVSDWLSSLSTFGTLVIAWLAYRKVPEWMAQKHYDVVHGIIENAVYKDLLHVKSSNIILRTKLIVLCRHLNRLLKNRKEEPEFITDMTKQMESTLEDFFNNSYAVINQLNSITRNDYELSEYTQNIVDKLNSTSEKYNYLFCDYLTSKSEIENLLEADQKAIDMTSQEIKDIENRVLEVSSELDTYIKQIFDNNAPIKEFIL